MSSTPTPAGDIAEVDQNDPCAVERALKAAYLRALSGQQETRIRFRNGENEEDVYFGPANISALRTEMMRQGQLCAALSSDRPARRCTIAG